MAGLLETARAFVDAYPYLSTFIVGAPVYLAVLYHARHILLSVMIAGFILVPFAPLAVFHETTYWSPQRLGGSPIGVEDALYLFVSGSFAWALAGLVQPVPAIGAAAAISAVSRAVKLTLAALAVWTVVALAPIGGFAASCIIAALAGLAGITMWPSRARAALIAGMGSALYHAANLAGILALNPDFAQAFASGDRPILLFATEMLFQFLLAAAHVLYFGWIIEPRGPVSRPDTRKAD